MSNNYQKGIFQNQTAFHLNNYSGNHFGELVSIIDNPNFVAPFRFYNNKSTKMDATFFSKSSLVFSNWVLNFDLQARLVNYNASGMLRDNIPVFIDQNFLFFNPKFGINYTFNNKNKMYFFAGIGQKEPNRSDFIDAKMNENPKAEKMLNFELGHIYNTEKLQIETNIFAMLYKDQLINTGAVNDVGSPIRQNVDKSYRIGAEFMANYQVAPKLTVSSSIAYNISKIVDYTYFINAFNEDYSINNEYTEKITKNNVDIAFTPRWNSFVELKWTGHPRTSIAINNKTVGKQYIDNTQETSKSIPLYSFFNFTAEHKIKPKFAKEIALNLLVNNLFDIKTFTNAYTYNTGKYVSSNGDITPASDFNYVFPQAGINVLMGMSMTF
jgi:iron complex outermembrane receptor protein